MANTVINEVIADGSVYANGFYGTGLANAFSFRAANYVLETGSSVNRFIDVNNVTLAGYASAAATLYFYNYNSPDRIEIYQGDTLIADIGSAVPLTASDRGFVLSSQTGSFFNDSPDLYLKDFVLSTANGQNYATFAGKITWTHNPASGRTYTIRTSKGNGSFDWRYILEYPIDGFTVGCPATPPVTPGARPEDPIPPPPPPPPPPTPYIAPPTGDGGGCGCKIVCTAMNESYGFGTFRQNLWLMDSKNMPPEYERGYHAIFLPLVKYCYYTPGENIIKKTTRKTLEHVVRHRTKDIWAQRKGKRDSLGRAYRAVFEPICMAAGKLTEKK
jgi:hypothetical protein